MGGRSDDDVAPLFCFFDVLYLQLKLVIDIGPLFTTCVLVCYYGYCCPVRLVIVQVLCQVNQHMSGGLVIADDSLR